MTYEIVPAIPFLFPEMIKRTDADGQVWWIPTDPANSDYQAYLASKTDQ
jgi:hypothetical protein